MKSGISEMKTIFGFRLGKYELKFEKVLREGGPEVLNQILDDWERKAREKAAAEKPAEPTGPVSFDPHDVVVAAIAAQAKCRPDEVVLEDDLFRDHGFDELDRVEATMRIEDVLNIEIPDEDVEAVTTVQGLIEVTKKAFGARRTTL